MVLCHAGPGRPEWLPRRGGPSLLRPWGPYFPRGALWRRDTNRPFRRAHAEAPRAYEEKTLRAGGPDWAQWAWTLSHVKASGVLRLKGRPCPATWGETQAGLGGVWTVLPEVGMFGILGSEGLLGRRQVVPFSNDNFSLS